MSDVAPDTLHRHLHYRAGELGSGPLALELDPTRAGWSFSSLRVLELARDETHTLETGADELIVLPLSGSCSVACDGEVAELAGRADVFSGITDFAYVPRDAVVRIASAGGGRFALPPSRPGGPRRRWTRTLTFSRATSLRRP